MFDECLLFLWRPVYLLSLSVFCSCGQIRCCDFALENMVPKYGNMVPITWQFQKIQRWMQYDLRVMFSPWNTDSSGVDGSFRGWALAFHQEARLEKEDFDRELWAKDAERFPWVSFWEVDTAEGGKYSTWQLREREAGKKGTACEGPLKAI